MFAEKLEGEFLRKEGTPTLFHRASREIISTCQDLLAKNFVIQRKQLLDYLPVKG